MPQKQIKPLSQAPLSWVFNIFGSILIGISVAIKGPFLISLSVSTIVINWLAKNQQLTTLIIIILLPTRSIAEIAFGGTIGGIVKESLLIIAIIIGAPALYRHIYHLRRAMPNVLFVICIFIFYFTVRSLISDSHLTSIIGLATYVAYIPLTVIITSQHNNFRKFLSISNNTLFTIATIVAFITIPELLFGLDMLNNRELMNFRAGSTTGSPLHLSVYLALTVPLVSARLLFKNKRSALETGLLILALATMSIGLFLTLSRGGWVQAAISLATLGVFLFLDRGSAIIFNIANTVKRVSLIGIPSICLILLILPINWAAFSLYSSRMYAIFDWVSDPGNVNRIQIWSSAWQRFESSPIVGLGLGSATNALSKINNLDSTSQITESYYLKLLVESGIIGLLLFVAVNVMLLGKTIQMIKSSHPIALEYRWLSIGIFSSVVGLLCEIATLQSLETQIINGMYWYFVGIIFGLALVTSNLKRGNTP